ncbi:MULTISPECIES: AraC family transcriptional regulator [Legionella]|uniref:AraC family transcriptional regulator n=1 Tax=Legionella drozanskii LLAP-1 TaxID=1212489 RepID=A0A0W0SRH3_9GAMM|nr:MULTISPECIES: AraC family transcriptional regulator [Legionella]KTC85821.1 AraC family transcriptional regulator [Legionella drozanskii LLAP-1]PJE16911.1 MAG: AraC family transcriptional regulator [Legionella sp.]
MPSTCSLLSLRSYETYNCSHSHDFAQLVFPINGIMELQTGNHFGLVHTNTAAFVAPHEIHCFAASRGNRFLVLDLKEPNFIANTQLTPAFLELPTATLKFLHFVQSYLLQENTDDSSDYLVQNLLLKLLSQTLMPTVDTRVLQVKQWIDNHFVLPIHIETLTKICHLSASQLQRRFKKMTGQTIAEYWRAQKLSHAQILLGTEQLSIEAIAYQLGYENLSAFSRRFTQTFGYSPSQWREMTLAAKKMR